MMYIFQKGNHIAYYYVLYHLGKNDQKIGWYIKVKKSYVNKVVQRVLMLKPKLNINVNKIEHGGISVET